MPPAWPPKLPAEFGLLEFTELYPLEDMLAEQRGLWSRFKRVLGKSKPHVPTRARQEWFTIYDEPDKGFVIFEDREIRRILMMESEEDAADLAGCRIVLNMFKVLHVALRDIKDAESVEFHDRFLAEVQKMCSVEPQSRKPAVFLQDVFSADAKLNGMFYQALCSIYGEVCRVWRSKEPGDKYAMTKAQDRVIAFYKERQRAPAPAWKELVDEAIDMLQRARAWAANPPARPKRKLMRDAGDINSIGGGGGEE
ncbi:MAG: hypothetical protein AB7K24_04360 [Gemmataceae bacterium]